MGLPENTSVNGTKDLFEPEIKPCGEHPIQRLAHLGGDLSGYVFDFGAGAYPRRTSKGNLHFCRDFVVQNGSASSIEIPVSISGSLLIGGGIAADDAVGQKNYAKTWLKISGAVGGESVSEKIELNGSGPQLAADQERSINTTRRLTLAPGTSAQTVHVEFDCEGYMQIQAHSSALFGLIAGAVTAQVSFPNSIDIGWPTGPGGAALPANVRIYDAEDGSVYVDTTASPVAIMPVPGQTPIWFFDQPFDAWLGPLLPASATVTAYGDTTVLSPPGATAGLVRRADTDADPLAGVTDHNAFRLTYTVAETNTTPAITVFIYDQPGGTPHALAYDLPLTPGYHEATLRFASGDASGRGVFAAGAPDLARLHSIGIANTLLHDWPAQSALITTGQVSVTFHHLAAFTAPPPGYEGFAITNHYLAPDGAFHLRYPASSNDYYLLYWGSQITAVTNPIAMALGVDGPGEFLVGAEFQSALPQVFFRLREVSVAQPLDLDGDGIDDLTEFRNPALYNPFVPATVIITNQPPSPPATNAPSNSGQIYLWTLNNHRYMPVLLTNGVTWDQANAAATAGGGYLATITSAAENDFVFALIDRPEYWQTWPTNPPAASGPWLGGWQSAGAAEPAGGWGWLTPEPFDFTAWNSGAPDNAASSFGANEDRLAFASTAANTRSNRWNDLPGALRLAGYVIEFDPPATGGDCIPRKGLIAWWKGDGNANEALTGQSGVIRGRTAFTEGMMGQAIMFDGSSGYIEGAPVPFLYPGANSYSLMFWLKTTSTQGNIFSIYPSAFAPWTASHYDFALYGQPGKVWCSMSIDESDAGISEDIVGWRFLANGTFHHVALVRDALSGQLRLYVDGTLDTTAPTRDIPNGRAFTDTAKGDPIFIGGHWDWSSSLMEPSFRGMIDDVLIYKRALTADEIAGIYSGGITGRCKPQCVEQPDGLVAWWPGEGNANDVIGGNNGTMTSGTTFVQGEIGQGFGLDGTTGGVVVPYNPTSPAFNLTTSFSYELWVNASSEGAFISRGQCSVAYASSEFGAYTFPDQSNLALVQNLNSANAPGTAQFISAPLMTTGAWHHVASTYDQGTSEVKMYLDGALVLVGAYSQPIWKPVTPLRIGGIPKPAGYPDCWFSMLNATIDEVRIYNRALTAGEIAGIYLAGSEGFCKKTECPQMPTDLVAWWPADGNANDIVGHNNGTLQGGASFAPGIAGQAFNLDGTTGLVVVPDSPAFTFGQKLTAAAWINPNRISNGGIITQYDSHAGLQSWGFSLYGGGLLGFTANRQSQGGDYFVRVRSAAVPPAHFVHVAASVDLSIPSIRLYLNGVEVESEVVSGSVSPTSFAETTSPIRIGGFVCYDGDLCGQFDGLIDDVMLFNRALAASEIQSLYQSVTPAPAAPVVDHGGTNWTVTPGALLGGVHVNIGEFVIPTNVVAEVAPFDGASGGSLEIRARHIRVDGVLNATGKGYSGGAGGGGGGGADQLVVNGGKPGDGADGGPGYLGMDAGESGAPGEESTGGNGGQGAAAGMIGAGQGAGGGAQACDTVGLHKPDCSGAGGRGGNGGAGAGGGILLHAPLVTVTGTLNNSGGSSTANGGTVKVFTPCDQPVLKGSITTGRLLRKGVLMR